jgi:hypothetical protein
MRPNDIVTNIETKDKKTMLSRQDKRGITVLLMHRTEADDESHYVMDVALGGAFDKKELENMFCEDLKEYIVYLERRTKELFKENEELRIKLMIEQTPKKVKNVSK